MSLVSFPVIDPAATGRNIMRLRLEQGLTVRDAQVFFGFEEPQASSESFFSIMTASTGGVWLARKSPRPA